MLRRPGTHNCHHGISRGGRVGAATNDRIKKQAVAIVEIEFVKSTIARLPTEKGRADIKLIEEESSSVFT
jgi:hypothetical protein